VSDAWYYADRHGQVGPFTLQELRETLTTFSTANASDLLFWHRGFPDWKPAKDVAELNVQTPLAPSAPGNFTRDGAEERPAESKLPGPAVPAKANDARADELARLLARLRMNVQTRLAPPVPGNFTRDGAEERPAESKLPGPAVPAKANDARALPTCSAARAIVAVDAIYSNHLGSFRLGSMDQRRTYASHAAGSRTQTCDGISEEFSPRAWHQTR
jgi:hypothetical protein